MSMEKTVADYGRFDIFPSDADHFPLMLADSLKSIQQDQMIPDFASLCYLEAVHFREQYPSLYQTLESLIPHRVMEIDACLEEPRRALLEHYFIGADCAVMALRASNGVENWHFKDLDQNYQESIAELDGIDMHTWFVQIRNETASYANPLCDALQEQLQLGPREIGAILTGVRDCYALLAHYNVCERSETNYCWMIKDVLDGSAEGWLSCRDEDYLRQRYQ